ncbi:MAG TPA: nucleotidyltransferase domain-containing protein [Solirubrobacterales bacterium]|nr:nucleotidyltransferase domain-containing protein [Solirubrobacterales bacterium]
MDAERRREVNRLLAELTRCAQADASIAALALVGSWARGAATDESDLDVLILGDRDELLARQPWAELTATAELVQRRRFGSVAERRYRLPSGLVLELGVASRRWASVDPVDAGTRLVISDGMRVVVDPEGLLERLRRAVAA